MIELGQLRQNHSAKKIRFVKLFTYGCCFHLSTRTLPPRLLIDSDMFHSTCYKLSDGSCRSHTTCDADK